MTVEEILARGIWGEAKVVSGEEATDMAKAALKALTDAGYAVVPKIATPEICEAGLFADSNKLLASASGAEMFNAYKAMIETGAHKV